MKIRSIISRPPGVSGKLDEVSTEALIECASDVDEREWRRVPVITELGRRLGADELAPLDVLLRNKDEETNIRLAALSSMCAAFGTKECEARAALIRWLSAQPTEAGGYGFYERLLAARAALGDVSVTRQLVVSASTPWTRQRTGALAALEALKEHAGEARILAELGHADMRALAADGARFEERLHGVRELLAAGEDVTSFLADSSRVVARHVFDALADREVDKGALLEMARSAPSQEARAWAALTLRRAGMSAADAMAFLDEPLVPLEGVADEIRHAVLREYRWTERDTDPRWLLEQTTLKEVTEEEQEQRTAERLERLRSALIALGLEPEAPISAGQRWQQGGGTYYDVAVPGSATLTVSTLGPYVIDEGEVAPPEVRAAAEACGLIWTNKVGGIEFTGLCVYFFGRREALKIHDLLFYWQD